jgi:hypothetical protein
MKKIILYFVLIVSAFSLSSCKKDRTCTCTTTSDAPNSNSSVSTVTYLDSKKRDATENCMGTRVTSTSTGYITTKICDLK